MPRFEHDDPLQVIEDEQRIASSAWVDPPVVDATTTMNRWWLMSGDSDYH